MKFADRFCDYKNLFNARFQGNVFRSCGMFNRIHCK